MVTQTSTRREGDVHVFEISGRLALGNTLMGVERELTQLVQDGAKKLVIDVAPLIAIDSAGIGTLLMISGKIDQEGGKMKISGATGLVKRTFEIVHLDRVVQQYEDVATAVASFDQLASAAN